MEIERKFVLPGKPDLLLPEPADIRQGYVLLSHVAEMRVRDEGGKCTLTTKCLTANAAVRKEWETEIPRWVYEILWAETGLRRIAKRRYRIPCEELVCEVDEYRGEHEGLWVLECEFPSQAAALAFTLPEWAAGAKEVTGDERYRNGSLTVRGVPRISN